MKNYRSLLVFLLIPALSGCSSVHTTFERARAKLDQVEFSLPSFGSQNAAPAAEIDIASATITCPEVTIIEDLATHHQFIEGTEPQSSNLISTATITGITSTCEITENNFVVDMEISFAGSLGVKTQYWNTTSASFAYPYFLAITAAGDQLLAKEVFGVTISYAPGQTEATATESLRQLIPLAGSFEGLPKLLVGFQLTEEQLAYNKATSFDPGAVPAEEPMSTAQSQALPIKKPADAARSAHSAAAAAKVAPVRKPAPAPIDAAPALPAVENIAPPFENVAPAKINPAPQPEETIPVIQPSADPAPQPEAVPVEEVIMEDIPPPDMDLIQPGEPVSLQPDPALLQPAQPVEPVE